MTGMPPISSISVILIEKNDVLRRVRVRVRAKSVCKRFGVRVLPMSVEAVTKWSQDEFVVGNCIQPLAAAEETSVIILGDFHHVRKGRKLPV